MTSSATQGARIATGAQTDWIAIGGKGWLHWHIEGWPDVRVRMTFDEEFRPIVDALSVQATGPSAVLAADLRGLPLGRLQDFMSTTRHLRLLDASANRDELTPYFDPCDLSHSAADEAALTLPFEPFDRSLRLPEEDGPVRSDGFYWEVSDVFFGMSLATESPAADIAAANGLPTTTVHRWIKEARRRCLLAPARRKDAADYTSARRQTVDDSTELNGRGAT